MKKISLLLLALCFFSGCAAEETFETISDELVQSVMAQPRSITVNLPDQAVAPVLKTDTQQMYLCEDYEILIETRSSGDVNDTIQSLSGYNREQLSVMETQWEDVTRYEFVWVSAGETGDQLGRAVVLDDGSYHYCMSVLRSAEGKLSQVVWSDVFQSFSLV